MVKKSRRLEAETYKNHKLVLLSACAVFLLSYTIPAQAESYGGYTYGADANFYSQQQISFMLSSQSSYQPMQAPGSASQFGEINDVNEDINDVNFLAAQNRQMSEIERMFNGTGGVSKRLRQFGYDVFQRPVSTFAPVTSVPVAADYLVGPGDTFMLTLWGRVNAQYVVEINRNGQIVLPEIGVLNVSGMTMAQMENYLQDQVARKQTDFKMAVTMGRLRTIKVYVVGEAKTPGSYTISSMSTVINALFAAGGPTKNGTLRDIQLMRNNSKPMHVDLYKFLIGGDKSEDIRLQDGDTVFVPLIGQVVGVSGSVKRPAIYEMQKPVTLREMLDLAGGVNYAGWMRQIQVARVENHQRQVVVDFNIAEPFDYAQGRPAGVADSAPADTIMHDGDMVKVFGVSPIEQGKRSAFISGEIYRPGEYRLKPGMKISDLIDDAGGLRKNAYLKTAELTRRDVSQQGMTTQETDIDLEKALAKDPANNVELQDYDFLIVREIPELEFDRAAAVAGQVRFPGVYPIRKGEKLSSLIERAGGFTQKAYLRGARFTRESSRVIQKQRMDELVNKIEESVLADTERAISGALADEDAQNQRIALATKKELLAKLKSAKIDGRVVVKLEELKQFKSSQYDIELEKGDSLFVPEMPGVVNVVGEVFNPTSLLYQQGKTVAYYLQKVGGPTNEAEKKQICVVKADGSVVSIAQENPDAVYWDSESHQWNFGGFMGIRLNPGDTIVVPRKMDKFLWLKTTKDLTQIIFQAALAAGVIIAM
jgi:protein involved in polysaccharide export with SLBB domain